MTKSDCLIPGSSSTARRSIIAAGRVTLVGFVTFYADTQVVHIGGESAKIDPAFTSASRQIAPLLVESELLYYRKHYGLLGLIESIVLTACGALMEVVKNAMQPYGKKT